MDAFQWQLRQNTDEYRQYVDSLADWEQEMRAKEERAKSSVKANKRSLPPVRNATAAVDVDARQEPPKERISSFDYRAWDKFDVDAACERVENESQNPRNSLHADAMGESAEQEVTEDMAREALDEKTKGNACFKKNDFAAAIAHYGKSIELDPYEAVYYLNRAMAYLKLKKYGEAENDCTSALAFEPKNIKALWRRSTARKYIGKLTDALEGSSVRAYIRLANVLAPTDASIKKDLCDLEAAILSKQDAPERRRIIIEEIGQPPAALAELPAKEESPKQPQPVVSEATSVTPKIPIEMVESAPTVKAPTQVVESTPVLSTTVKEEQLKAAAMSQQKPVVSSVVTSSTTTSGRSFAPPKNAIEFERDWKCVKASPKDLYDYVKQIEPTSLPALFKANLQSEHISQLAVVLNTFYRSEKTTEEIAAVLLGLSKTDRFGINVMFLGKAEKNVLASLFEHLTDNPPSAVDLPALRKAYGVK